MSQPERSPFPFVIFGLAIATVIGFAIATRQTSTEAPSGDPIARGKRLYELSCVVCHHRNPSQQLSNSGTYGPPIANSSLELMRMRVQSTSYPEGYQPKRKTKLMPTFELLTGRDIRDLHAYVNAPDAW